MDANFAIIFVGFLTSGANLFVYCFFGKLATDSYGEMATCLFESNWQVLPIDLRKYLILMIGNAQRPLYYHGFKIAVLNLETFLKVGTIQIENIQKNGFYLIFFFTVVENGGHLLHDV